MSSGSVFQVRNRNDSLCEQHIHVIFSFRSCDDSSEPVSSTSSEQVDNWLPTQEEGKETSQ